MSQTMQHPARAAGRLLAVLAALLAMFAIAGSAAHAATTIKWDQFERPGGPVGKLPDGDRIQLVKGTGAPEGYIQVVMTTRTTWRKGIESMRMNNVCGWFGCSPGLDFVRGIYLQDADHGPATMLIPLSDAQDPDLGYGALRFAKAKLFGILTPVYDLPWDAAHVHSGDKYTFSWITD